jgi:hypothetical protein
MKHLGENEQPQDILRFHGGRVYRGESFFILQNLFGFTYKVCF